MAEPYSIGPNFTAVCETCGAVVSKQEIHDRWHDELRAAMGNGKH